MNEKEAIFIETRYSDGQIMRAEGNDAAVVVDWFNAVEGLASAHGWEFKDRPMQEIRPPDPVPPVLPICETTMTPRLAPALCAGFRIHGVVNGCGTYPDNLGPC